MHSGYDRLAVFSSDEISSTAYGTEEINAHLGRGCFQSAEARAVVKMQRS